MDIKALKERIENNNLDDSFMIWIATDDNIIVDQYLRAISDLKHLDIKFIESLKDIPEESFIQDLNLYVIHTKKWEDENIHDNCIVICESTKNKNAIEFPKLEDWQVIDYCSPKLPGISEKYLEVLIKQYASNFARFILDMDKLACFPKGEQLSMLEETIKEGCYDTLSDATVFDLTTALIKNDRKKVVDVLSVKNYIDLTPMHFWTIITNNFKNIIGIQLDNSVTASKLGISEKQFWVVKKYNCGTYTQEQLILIYKMLCSIENKFKFESLDMNDLIDYIVCKILEVSYLC